MPESEPARKGARSAPPWEAYIDNDVPYWLIVDQNSVVVTMIQGGFDLDADQEHARLIAEAPAMKDELRRLREIARRWCHYQGNTPELFEEYLGPADAILARIDGEGGE